MPLGPIFSFDLNVLSDIRMCLIASDNEERDFPADTKLEAAGHDLLSYT